MRKITIITRTVAQSFRLSVQNIVSNKMRSFLTMLGIIIGVTAVIALVTTVSGVSDYTMSQFSSMGAGSLTVSATGTPLKSGLSDTDLDEIAALDNVDGVSPSISINTNVVYNETVYYDVAVTGRNEQYFKHNSDLVAYGRSLYASDMDGTVMVCLVDQTCARALFPGEYPVGKTVKIGGAQYTVVGLCGSDESVMSALMGEGGDSGSIYIPYKNALKLNGRSNVNRLDIYVKDTTQTSALVDRLELLLDNTFNNEDSAYMILNMESLLDTMNTMQDMLTSLLAGIASIALLVGGIGIMNMMLVSVTERTKEIGLRKALGAEPGIIQLQFLMEATILSLVGGVLGILFGEILSFIATKLIGTEFVVNLGAIALGFGFSLAVGIVFGWAPARNASRLNPIDALRSE